MIKLTGMQLLVLTAFLENVTIELPPHTVMAIFPVLRKAGLLEFRSDDSKLHTLTKRGREVAMSILDREFEIEDAGSPIAASRMTVHNTAYVDWLHEITTRLYPHEIIIEANSISEENMYQTYQNGVSVERAVEAIIEKANSDQSSLPKQKLPRNYNRDQGIIAGDPDQLGD